MLHTISARQHKCNDVVSHGKRVTLMRSFDSPVNSAYEQYSFMDTFYLEGKLIVQTGASAAEMIN